MTKNKNTNGRAKKIRAGLYDYRGWTIEKMDETSEYYPGDYQYGLWLTTDPTGYKVDEYMTMRDAKQDIDHAAEHPREQ